MIRIPAVFVALYWVPLALAAESLTENPRQWLERKIQSSQKQSFSGTFIYMQGGQSVEVMRVVYSSSKRQQRMVSLTGMPRDVVVNDRAVICSMPEQQLAISAVGEDRSPFPISLPHQLEPLESWYLFESLGDDRVADRKTRTIAIRPRDKLRFGYRLWLDEQSGLVLRSALIDETGEFLEQLVFTEIELMPEVDTALLKPHFNPAAADPVSDAAAVESPDWAESWQFEQLPAGFRQVSYRRYPDGNGQTPSEHMVFSDGLATVSVFVEPLLEGGEALLDGFSHLGAMRAYGRVVDNNQVLVVGEVPALTAQRLATSIGRKNNVESN